jgi:DNA modification methylase
MTEQPNDNNLINKVLLGDIRNVYDKLPNKYIQSIITSPPYFGHRKYAVDDASQNEIGRRDGYCEVILFGKNQTQCHHQLQTDPQLTMNTYFFFQ